MAALRAAMRHTFTLWGGRFNPIIPIREDGDSDFARQLARLFRADVLYPMSDAPEVAAFVDEHPHLRWPSPTRSLIEARGGHGKASPFADLLHPIQRIYRETYRNNPSADPLVTLHDWHADDPLADLMLAVFGGVPAAEESAEDYLGLLRMHLKAERAIIGSHQPLPGPSADRWTLAGLNGAFVERHFAVRNHWNRPGIFIGDATSFGDLVQFWNLRATATELQFYDPAHSARLDMLRDTWLERVSRAYPTGHPGGAAIWGRGDDPFDTTFLPGPITQIQVDEHLWNGLNVKAPVMHFGEESVLASVDRSRSTPNLTFALPGRPKIENGSLSDQKCIVSIEPGIGLYGDDLHTLHFPAVPELNEFYSRNAYYGPDAVRAEPGSLGVVISGSTNHLTVRALDATQLIAAVFRSVGIAAAPSSAGLVCSRLIRQMGGLDGCRVFRIGGVRDLIEGYGPDQSFTTSAAKMTIRAHETDHPLSDYQDLYIEQRDIGSGLTNDAVFAHLLEKEVFRPGLKLCCPSCRLDFWRSLDDVRTRTECEYCGHVFNLGRQLRDRDWAFRRTGLFGRSDNQEGALPVMLTIQQLAKVADMSGSTFATALSLVPGGADIANCETDFVLLPRATGDGPVEIAIGECKTRQPISAEDVENLRRVADAFPRDQFRVYVVFAKLAEFSEDEIALIEGLNEDHHLRAIVLTTRELEPWHVYERTREAYEIDPHAVSLSSLAATTQTVFFDRRCRAPTKAPRQ